MTEIKKVAVIGSGVMGASIAAHVANSGTPVILLDIVPKDAKDRSQLAKDAIEKLLKSNPAALTHKKKAKLIKPGNLEDDLKLLSDVDWIIEVVIERLDIKQELYKKLDGVRKKGSVVSSNTSTLPLNNLTEKMPDSFKSDFMITHFFNPPRYMRLLELVTSPGTRKDAAEAIRNFCDVKLGKGVVVCKDTPGFIANRIGVFWLAAALQRALEMGVSVTDADAVMGKPIGVPKTGAFGLMDLIGIDLLPLIAKSFASTLDKNDAFFKVYKEHEIITKMIADGYTGRKGKGGFYRLNTEGGKKDKEVKDLKTGGYLKEEKSKLASAEAARDGLNALVTHSDKGGKYAWAVLRDLLHYTASLVPEISDDIASIDEAMRLGYNWKYGPFELIDRLGTKDVSGPKWFAERLKAEGLSVPEIIAKAGDKPLYQKDAGRKAFVTLSGKLQQIAHDKSAWSLEDIKESGAKPVTKNPSAALWDVGDGIVCLEFTSKMNSLDPMSLELIAKATEIVKKDFKGMIVGNDADNFCVGANIGVLLFASNVAAWKTIDGIIKQGQDTYMGLKYAPFPVVSAPTGMALGGGCEILLHSDAVQAHVELYTGLVEVGVGIIPGWGGCKEMLYRNLANEGKKRLSVAQMGGMFALSVKQAINKEGSASMMHPIRVMNTMPAIEPAFRNISTANVSKSAEEARDMMILNDKSRITMNRKRLLADAKELCLQLAVNYQPPHTHTINLPGKTARTALDMAVKGFVKSGKATPHDVVVSTAVGYVLSGGETDITKELTEQQILDLEREQFVELCKNPNTLARVEHMLEKGKPLRN